MITQQHDGTRKVTRLLIAAVVAVPATCLCLALASPLLLNTAPSLPLEPPPAASELRGDSSSSQAPGQPTDTSPGSATVTQSPTVTPELGAIGNPHPFGQAAEISVGLFSLGPSLHVSVLEVIRGQRAWDNIYIANVFNDRSPEGFEWMLIRVLIENRGDPNETASIGPGQFAMRSGGRLIDYWDVALDVCCLSEVGMQELEDVDLYGGGQAEGWLAFPVAVDDPAPLLKVGDAFMSLTTPES